MIFIRSNFKNQIYGADFREKFENGGMPRHVDLPRLDKGKQGGAFWSAFMVCPVGDGTNFSDARYSKSKNGPPLIPHPLRLNLL